MRAADSAQPLEGMVVIGAGASAETMAAGVAVRVAQVAAGQTAGWCMHRHRLSTATRLRA